MKKQEIKALDQVESVSPKAKSGCETNTPGKQNLVADALCHCNLIFLVLCIALIEICV